MAEVDLIVKWQQTVSPERDADEPPLVAHLYKACSELYSGILAKITHDASIGKPVLLSLQRSHSYLVLWADGFGVGDGLLDTSLDRSRRAKSLTLRLLFSICQTLTKRLLPIVAPEQQVQLHAKANAVAHAADKLKYLTQQDDTGDSDSDTSSETSSVSGASDLDEIAEDLKTDSECLLDLGSRFNEQAVGPVVTEKSVDPAQLSTWDPSKNFIDRICWRYPQCDPDLAERLGKANWARVLEYQKTKDLYSRPQQSIESPYKPGIDSATKASSSKVASTTFHDSALGSSVPSARPALSAPPNPVASQYAETVVSYHGCQGESVRIPSLPEGAKKGMPFACVGCGRRVTISNKSLWKKHLFSDLKPYVCLDSKCDFNKTPFSTKSEWEDHLALDHDYPQASKGCTCPICQEKFSDGLMHVKTHLARHLEEISLTVLPTNLDSEDGTDDDSGLASSETSSQDKEDQDTIDTMWPQSETASRVTDLIEKIERSVFDQLLEMDDLKVFHQMISQVREKMHIGMTLRDIETALIYGAQESAPNPELFQKFGLVVFNTIRGVLPLIEKSGQTRPDEQPYDEEYLVDAEKQVRRKARQMNDMADEEHLKPKSRGLDNSQEHARDSSLPVPFLPIQVDISMVRRKKSKHFQEPKMCKEPGCEKKFVRSCDLIKHEKSHSRPWKCPVLTCKYNSHGWPTEKELNRHVADKHSEAPAMFECQFKPCPYKSKRESNCKQHMEKAHGWTYVRSKTNTNKRGVSTAEATGGSSVNHTAEPPADLAGLGYFDPDQWIPDPATLLPSDSTGYLTQPPHTLFDHASSLPNPFEYEYLYGSTAPGVQISAPGVLPGDYTSTLFGPVTSGSVDAGFEEFPSNSEPYQNSDFLLFPPPPPDTSKPDKVDDEQSKKVPGQEQHRFPCTYRGCHGKIEFTHEDHLIQHAKIIHEIDYGADNVLPMALKTTPNQVCIFPSCPQYQDGSSEDILQSLHQEAIPFNDESDYVQHMRREHGWSSYPCSINGCDKVGGKGYFSQTELRDHHNNAHPEIKI
ncbi:hypothetical protein F5X99DRAFT_385546 [Biscogniauxia marginata]|nr:hypothetical protein F5X99DRAFT_385546 [Biscogniauxia marginata]